MTLALRFKDLTTGAAGELEFNACSPDYDKAEQQFIRLLATEDLDGEVWRKPKIVSDFENAITVALREAYP